MVQSILKGKKYVFISSDIYTVEIKARNCYERFIELGQETNVRLCAAGAMLWPLSSEVA